MRGTIRTMLVILTLSFTLCGATASLADGPQLPPQKWALLVGVNDYTHFSDLEYCRADVEGLKQRLIEVGFPQDNVTLLTNGAEKQHHLPFKSNIERQLQLLLATVREQDLVVVAFSGHGLHLSGTSYLCPTDSLLSEPDTTMVSLDTVYEMLQSCPARQKLLLVDACRNDPSLPGAKSAVTLKNAEQFVASLGQPPEGILLLTSCKEGQRSVEDPQFGHGVFLYFVMEGLKGAADADGDDKISLFELYMYSELKTKTYVRNTCNLVQTPVMKGEIAGVYDIGSVPDGPSLVKDTDESAESVNQDEAVTDVADASPSTDSALRAGRDDPGIKAAIAQADEYFVQGKLDEAIEAYSTVMLIDSTNRDLNLKRGSVYLAKGDIEQAVIDYQLGGKPLPLPVTAESAKLQSGVEVKATVRRGQTLAITKITKFNDREWLFVAAVDGNDAARGWIRMDAVTKQAATKTVSQGAITTNPSQRSSSRYYPENQNQRSRYQTPLQRLIEQGLQREQMKRQRLIPQRTGGRNRW